jgi:hypothetical protein
VYMCICVCVNVIYIYIYIYIYESYISFACVSVQGIYCMLLYENNCVCANRSAIIIVFVFPYGCNEPFLIFYMREKNGRDSGVAQEARS